MLRTLRQVSDQRAQVEPRLALELAREFCKLSRLSSQVPANEARKSCAGTASSCPAFAQVRVFEGALHTRCSR